ncbi:MAG TPA: DSD1 family PLP-dependent enzyme [Holophaga sp.]|nr:DSD1 family PLP-dependent enzyme [Holophaga sp.]
MPPTPPWAEPVPPASVGMALEDVDTPALLLDLEAFEANLDRLDASLAGMGLRVRPHTKSHKCPEIARRQMARGAVGVCCQKVSEAERMVAGRIDDVLVTNEIVGPRKLARLARLAGHARVGVCVDDPSNVQDISRAAREAGTTLDVLVELDVGLRRCGVDAPADALVLARLISQSEGLRFGGLQAYHGGAQHLRTPEERREAIDNAVAKVRATMALLAGEGMAVPVVTGAGTGTYPLEAASGIYRELQPGSYVFMDADYGRNLGEDGQPVHAFRQSLFLLTTVMSRPCPGQVVVDAGLKAHSVDSGMPLVTDLPGGVYTRASDEHGVIEVPDASQVPLGRKVRLIPGHCDPTVNLHDWLVCHRGGRVEDLWPIAARGAFF